MTCIPGCTATPLHGKPFCMQHYMLVPKRLQEDISRHGQAKNRAVKPNMKLATARRYRETIKAAREAVIAAVGAKGAA